jgi:hypothetical protein
VRPANREAGGAVDKGRGLSPLSVPLLLSTPLTSRAARGSQDPSMGRSSCLRFWLTKPTPSNTTSGSSKRSSWHPFSFSGWRTRTRTGWAKVSGSEDGSPVRSWGRLSAASSREPAASGCAAFARSRPSGATSSGVPSFNATEDGFVPHWGTPEQARRVFGFGAEEETISQHIQSLAATDRSVCVWERPVDRLVATSD